MYGTSTHNSNICTQISHARILDTNFGITASDGNKCGFAIVGGVQTDVIIQTDLWQYTSDVEVHATMYIAL